MDRCIIFCAGGFSGLIEPVKSDDYVIAADGGLLHAQSLGLTPDLILGDFDSLGYVPEESTLFPVEKDDTDAMLAVRKGLELGCKEFLLYGSLDGPRLDHTVANFQTLQFLADHGAKGHLIGQTQIATLVKNGNLTFPADAAGYISLFCLGDDARGVSLENLKYTLEDATLSAGFPLGVSNQFIGKSARISVKLGSLLVIYERQGGAYGTV